MLGYDCGLIWVTRNLMWRYDKTSLLKIFCKYLMQECVFLGRKKGDVDVRRQKLSLSCQQHSFVKQRYDDHDDDQS